MRTIKVKSLSWSTVSAFLLCPDKVWLDKVEKRPKFGVAPQLIFGSAVHAAAAAWFLSLKVGRPIELTTCERIISNRFYGATDVLYEPDETPESMIKKATELIGVLIENGPPEGKIVGVEVPIKFKIAHDLYIVGQADLLTRNRAGKLVVTDLKTSARSYAEDDCRKVAEQTLLYEYGLLEPSYSQAIVLVKTKTPKIQVLDLSDADVDFEELKNKILGVKQCLENGIHWKQRGWQCSGCQFADECKRSRESMDIPYRLAA